MSAATNVERLVTSGTFELDGGSWDVDNNIWIVGDQNDVVVFDAAHSAAPIIEAVAGRNVVAVICTHGHNDHVTVAPELSRELDAPVLLHPADDVLWRMTHPEEEFRGVEDGLVLHAGEVELRALHTPGHSPGSVCWYAPDLGAVFSGDTLFSGGPGATGRSYSDFPHHSGVDLRAPRHPPRPDRRLHRSRRHHHRRRRDRQLRRVGQARKLERWRKCWGLQFRPWGLRFRGGCFGFSEFLVEFAFAVDST